MKTFLWNIVLGAVLATPGSAQALKAQPVSNPSGQDSLQANWSVTRDGNPILSWVEVQDDGSQTLRYAIRRGAQWSETRTIVDHRQFFNHPAELPGMVALADGTLLAYWVEVPGDEDEAEFLHVSSSRDSVHWTKPVIAHKDRSMVQHGLASMVASGDSEASLIWLEALKGEDGPVSLKRTVVNAAGNVVKEESLDPDVCSCCPTSVVKTARGLLIAYRDHTPQNIRDIATLRLENGRWTASKNLNPDNWKINACPINAASAAAQGDRVAIAWYTGAQDMPRVQMVFSTDGGTTFGKPVPVSTGRSLGYTSVVLDEQGGTFVSWLEQSKDGIRLLVRQVSAAGAAGPVTQVAQGSRQDLGYPRLVRAGTDTWIAYSGSAKDTKVQTARLVK